MKRFTLITGILITIFFVQATQAGSYNLRGKSKIDLNISMRDYKQEISYLDEFTKDKSFDDAQIAFGFSYWSTENSAVTFSIAAAEVANDTYYDQYGSFTLKSSIVPIFWGSKFYLTDNHGYTPMKPYFAISGGPVLGINNFKSFGDNYLLEDDVYVAFGAYFGGGIDFLFGENMMFGVNGGYNAFTDFDEYIGDRDNFSGAEIGMSFGFLFGGEKEYHKSKPKKRKKRVVKF